MTKREIRKVLEEMENKKLAEVKIKKSQALSKVESNLSLHYETELDAIEKGFAKLLKNRDFIELSSAIEDFKSKLKKESNENLTELELNYSYSEILNSISRTKEKIDSGYLNHPLELKYYKSTYKKISSFYDESTQAVKTEFRKLNGILTHLNAKKFMEYLKDNGIEIKELEEPEEMKLPSVEINFGFILTGEQNTKSAQ